MAATNGPSARQLRFKVGDNPDLCVRPFFGELLIERVLDRGRQMFDYEGVYESYLVSDPRHGERICAKDEELTTE